MKIACSGYGGAMNRRFLHTRPPGKLAAVPEVVPMSALLQPAPVSPRRPLRWTVKQFHDLGDRGYFEGRRASLIHGTIFEEGPMNPPHAVAGEKTEELIRDLFRGWTVWIRKPLVLAQDTDPMPDIAVLAGRPTVAGGHPTTAALVIEIADSSLDDDLTTKAELYATANIPEYWVLDVDGRALHVFRDPAPLPTALSASAYRTHDTFTESQSVAPLALPTASIRFADMLP
jgi:Uma2 family endonuclease